MAKTITQINTELTVYQCCIADLAYKYMTKEGLGIKDPCLLNKVIAGVTFIENLKCPENVIDNSLTQEEYELCLEQLNQLCGCVYCNDSSVVTNDTLLTS